MRIARAKFTLNYVTHTIGNPDARIFKFHAVSDKSTPETERFTQFTPSGTLEMNVTNPAVIEQMKLGRQYYLDVIPVEEEAPKEGA